ncbi:hypothetical protein SLH46_10720 [Draconibacterium sp. IB214405]|uniref:hypothetical protein n=1 Tax=Draconibacterium sp. IB214405 TaxID=3097352 RepID=UPI002A0EA411|nr:hypothetical protein [Draconibacterium sp. IB214405]MDX8339658.1 hypothetical protein [Draconibacterium sp. IB214405]
MLELPIYSEQRKYSLFMPIIVLAGFLIVSHILIPEYSYGLIAFAVMALFLFLFFTKNKLKNTGKIYLNTTQINVESEQQNFTVDIATLDSLEITYSGYNGKRMQGDIIGPFNSFSGYDNYLVLTKDRQNFKCQFLIADEKEENNLYKLIAKWKNCGFDVSKIKIVK